MAGTRGQGARRRRTQKRAEVRQAMRKRRPVDALVAAGSGSGDLPLGPRTAKWDAAAADKAVRTWADTGDAPNAKYAKAFMVKQGDGSKFGDYKLGFAQPDGDTLTANWGGITAIAGVLSGARGGADITDAEAAHAKSMVEGYYADARAKYDDDSIEVPWRAKDAASVAYGEEHGLDVLLDADGSYGGLGGDFDPVELVEAQAWAMARSLAYAQFAEADPALLSIASSLWEKDFAPAPAAGTGKLVWDAEDGVMDLMSDLSEALNPGDSWRWWVVDVALAMDKAILCDGDKGEYWLAPFTVGDDREPTLAPQSDWTPVESAWVASDGELAVLRAAEAFQAVFAMGACQNCDHAYSAHLGSEGPCTTEGCDCNGYQAPETDADGATVKDSVTLAFADDSIEITPPADGGSIFEWSAVLAPEGRLTSDGRAFAPGSIEWPRLADGPLALMALLETGPGGHQGAKLSGQITDIWRDDSVGLIRAKGLFDTGEFGAEVARLVDDRTLRGVSVDLAIDKFTYGPRSDWFDDDGRWAPKAEAEQDQRPPVEILFDQDDPEIAVVLRAEIGMVTVCPFPAFKEAQISIGDSLVATGSGSALWTATSDGGFLVASGGSSGALTAAAMMAYGVVTTEAAEASLALTAAAAGIAAERPPAEWFADPMLDGPTALSVDDNGRVSGHAALWETCHIGIQGRCQQPPHSEHGYAYFHLGEVECDDGSRPAVGTITLDTGHAAQGLGRVDATRHYDHTGTAVAYVRCGEDEHGIWVAGALRADASADKASLLRGAKLSGDWRRIDGALELVALLTVNVPGFPVPRPRELVASGEVVTLVAAGIVLDDVERAVVDELTAERLRAMAAHEEFAALAARA